MRFILIQTDLQSHVQTGVELRVILFFPTEFYQLDYQSVKVKAQYYGKYDLIYMVIIN